MLGDMEFQWRLNMESVEMKMSNKSNKWDKDVGVYLLFKLWR